MNRFNLMLLSIFCCVTVHTRDLGGEHRECNEELSDYATFIDLACNDLVHLSLDTNCYAELTPEMLLEDLDGLSTDYVIQVEYAKVWSNDINFDQSHINKTYNYRVIHIATGNSCWGKVRIEDKYPPGLICDNDTLRCGDNFGPDLLGFPIPPWFNVNIVKDTNKVNAYYVYGWDACSKVYLYFVDRMVMNTCDSTFIIKIYRDWTAADSLGNTSKCTDTICILRPTEQDIDYPPHYDGFDLDHLSCTDSFPKLPNGHPSPDFTGHPVPKLCKTMAATFSDLRIEICVASYKLIRRWTIFDWCTGRIIYYDQIIKVIDDEGPVFVCPVDFSIGMQAYNCEGFGKLPEPNNVKDCGNLFYKIFATYHKPVPGIDDEPSTKYIIYNKKDSCYYFDGGPQGEYTLLYIVTDDCGNSSTCEVELTVNDNLAPIAICDQKTVVTLTNDGTGKIYAETFDDGSLDNCGILKFEVRRMTPACDSANLRFRPFVEFCCLDVGLTVMVALQVTDSSGNVNTCMVEVTVQEKVPPVVIPPTDVTITCDQDYTNLDEFGVVRLNAADRKDIIIKNQYYSKPNFIAGIDGLAIDNCFVRLRDSVVYDLKCNAGIIYRYFIATDAQGFSSIGVQRIFVTNPKPFSRRDIDWPRDRTIRSCRKVETHPDITGYPEFDNKECAQVASNYEDLKLIVLDSACYKILRKWTVIDWCQFNAQDQLGIWEHTQIIYVINSENPEILTCNDVEICDFKAYYDPKSNICFGNYELIARGEDDCTKEEDLIWTYRLDIDNDGSFEPLDSGNIISGVLHIGTHRVRWIVQDQCGNYSQCDQIFTIKDCKKPTPYCINGIVTVVMQGSGEVRVWAKDLNLNSEDNCTPKDRLIFSFSPDTSFTSVLYNCDSLNGQISVQKLVRIYVTDESGNQDYCETFIRISDNNRVCGTTNFVGGSTTKANQSAIPDVLIELKNENNNVFDYKLTDLSGKYSFQDLTVKEFSVHPSKTDDISNGVTTYDIVLIQKHILGINTFKSPYQIIAADANNSSSVTARDISEIRKVILGLSDQFPNNKIWRFVPQYQA
ncbi:MAG: hypothetical protein M3Q56_06450, partial [Bacteroidota bacterium]|nr:hypothetical protein [Bacteroidota bacterium]